MRLVLDPDVFEPGPISAAAVDALVRACIGLGDPVVADVGTGSGAIAIAFALRRPDARVFAVDVSPTAVACAERNARALGADNVTVLHGSLLEPLLARNELLDAVVANIPWVPDAIAQVKELLRPDRWRGPRPAIVGTGRDGLGMLRQLVRQARPLLKPHGFILLEMDDWQTELFAREHAAEFDVDIAETRYSVTLRPRVS